MKIVAVHHATIPISPSPLAAQRPTWQRNGLLIKIINHRQQAGLGVAAPLPGYSPESLQTVTRALTCITPRICAANDLDVECPETLFKLSDLTRLPSLRFALQTALLDLAGQTLGQPIWQLLDPCGTQPPTIELNSLVTCQTTPNEIDQLLEAGCRVFKVKVGRGDHLAEISSLTRLRSLTGGDTEIRLDANRNLSADECAAKLADYQSIAPAFVEEPTPFGQLPRPLFHRPLLGVDETLATADATNALKSGRYQVAVLKPALLGGYDRALALAKCCGEHHLATTVTHMMDGPLATLAASHLAFSLPTWPLACGLADGFSHPRFTLDAPTDPGLGGKAHKSTEAVVWNN